MKKMLFVAILVVLVRCEVVFAGIDLVPVSTEQEKVKLVNLVKMDLIRLINWNNNSRSGLLDFVEKMKEEGERKTVDMMAEFMFEFAPNNPFAVYEYAEALYVHGEKEKAMSILIFYVFVEKYKYQNVNDEILDQFDKMQKTLLIMNYVE
jgi:hypothetical protein